MEVPRFSGQKDRMRAEEAIGIKTGKRLVFILVFGLMLLCQLCPPAAAERGSGGQTESPDLWENMETKTERMPDGKVRVSLSLTEEQAAQASRIELSFLQRLWLGESGAADSFIQIWKTEGQETQNDRTWSAVFPEEAIYAVDDLTGEVLAGPIDCLPRNDGSFLIYVLYADGDGILDENRLFVLYECAGPDESGKLAVLSAEDIDTEQPLERIPDETFFSNTDYSQVLFYHLGIKSGNGETEVLGLPGWQWEDGTSYDAVRQRTGGWHFETRKMTEGLDLVRAVFRITDTQDHRHVSQAVSVFPEMVREYTGTFRSDGSEAEGYEAEVRAEHFLGEDCLLLNLSLSGIPDDIETLKADRFAINDSVLLPDLYEYSEDGMLCFALPHKITAGVEQIQRIGFDLKMGNGNYGEESTVYVNIDFPEPVVFNREGASPLAESEAEDGLLWRVRDIRVREDNKICIDCEVTNPSEKTKSLELEEVIVGGLVCETSRNLEIALGQTVVTSVRVDQSVTAYNSEYHAVSQNPEPLAELGVSGFTELRLRYTDRSGSYSDLSVWEAAFCWGKEIPYETSAPGDATKGITLLSVPKAEIRLGECTLFQDPDHAGRSAALGLWLENRGDARSSFRFEGFTADGERISNRFWLLSGKAGETEVPGHAVRYFYILTDLPDTAVSELSFDCFLDGKYAGTVTVDPKDGKK